MTSKTCRSNGGPECSWPTLLNVARRAMLVGLAALGSACASGSGCGLDAPGVILTRSIGDRGVGDEVHRRVSASEFVAMMESGPSATRTVAFIGKALGRVYLSLRNHHSATDKSEDICSVAIDELPVTVRDALRDGVNPWMRYPRMNDPGISQKEDAALRGIARLPVERPIVVIMRCASGQTASIARDHFDHNFTTDNVVPVPVPCDLVLVVTADGNSAVSAGGVERTRLRADETVAIWYHLSAPDAVDVVVQGAAEGQGSPSVWRVALQGVRGSEFYNPSFDRRRGKT